MPYNATVRKHIKELSRRGFPVKFSEATEEVFVTKIDLLGNAVWRNKSGRTIDRFSALIGVDTANYPNRPPGVGRHHPTHAIHVPFITCNGTRPRHLLECCHADAGWWWLCFKEMDWRPRESNLVELIGTIQHSLLERAGRVVKS